MRRVLLAFLLGVVIASAVWIAVVIIERGEEIDAIKTLDFLIDTWTEQREEPLGDKLLAQLPARIELPDARPGFFPDTVKALAQRLQTLHKIPKGVVLAQWALESSWGRSNLGLSNYFGHTYQAVKPYLLKPRFAMRREQIATDSGIVAGKPVAFALYTDMAECFSVHGLYLSQSRRYANAFKQTSSESFARALSKASYAQDRDYGLKLITIMRRYKL